jgi:hypothetical protein
MSGRDCGGCTLCCKVLGIAELEKPKGRWCPHCAVGRGCGAYEDRPRECRTFNCLWLLRETLGPEWRPDRAKFVLCPTEDNSTLLVHVDPGAPDAWRRAPYHATLRQWSRDANAARRQVVVMTQDRATVVLPDRDVALGPVRPGDRIVSRLVTENGRERIEPRVERAAP